jgi:hypothetical protein
MVTQRRSLPWKSRTKKKKFDQEPELKDQAIEVEEEEAAAVTTRSGRIVQRPGRFLAVTKVSRSVWKEASCEEAIKAELR